jgi:hypothetical protein
MSADNYKEFRVRSIGGMRSCWEWLRENFKAGYARPFVVILATEDAPRSKLQNRRWRAMLGDIAEQVVVNGVQYEAHAWAEYFKRKYGPMVDVPHGAPVPLSTTQYTVKQMADLMQNTEAEAVRDMCVRFAYHQGER